LFEKEGPIRNAFSGYSLGEQPTVRILHHKFAALFSAVLVVFSGGAARGEHVMSKASSKAIRPAFPRIRTTRSGSRYVRSIDVIRSKAGRKEIDLQLKNQPREKISLPTDPDPPKDKNS